MHDASRLTKLLAEHHRKRALPNVLSEAASLFGGEPNEFKVTGLDRLRSLQLRIEPTQWGARAAFNCSVGQVQRFLTRLSSSEEQPVWLVSALPAQDAVGALGITVARVLPVWAEIAQRTGFLDMISEGETCWVTISWDDHNPENPYTIEAGGRWAEILETTPENLLHARSNISDVHEDGKRWLEHVPTLMRDLAGEWNLRYEPHAQGNYSIVIPCGEYMLKLMPPSDNFNHELATMLAWNGNGAARVHKHDAERGAMLIERLRPGTELTALFHRGRDEETTEIACTLMPRLAIPLTNGQIPLPNAHHQIPLKDGHHQIPLPSLGGARGGLAAPDPTPIPTAADRAADLTNLRKRFNGKTGPFPPHLVEAAETLFKELIASQGPPHLIHADLHHENILQSERGWLAIDPHGLIAEREFEAYSWLNNPNGLSKNPDLKAITKRRLHQISDLTGFGRERIRGWAIACAVLSSWWSFDGHGTANEADLAVAETLLTV